MSFFEIIGRQIYKCKEALYEDKYRAELSSILMSKFGEGPYNEHDLVREIVVESYNYFCRKFVELCQNEDSVCFYQFILWQHEEASDIAVLAKNTDFNENIDRAYVAIYRRILKWILEEGCCIKLNSGMKAVSVDLERSRQLSVLSELYFLGSMIFECSDIYAEQDMIEDVVEVIFDEEKKYKFNHKHHYDYVIQSLNKEYQAQSTKTVVDENGMNDLFKAINDCFGMEYGVLTTVIKKIHEELGGQYVPFEWNNLPINAQRLFRVDYETVKNLFLGLTLDKDNKIPINILACKPNAMERYIYRPILIWNIDGVDYAIVGVNGIKETIMQLVTNCIPWGKAPKEWIENKCFKKYVHTKEDQHDKWLDDEVEKQLKSENLTFYRNITGISTPHGSMNLTTIGVGEIDFLIIDHNSKTIYIVDCKHLQGRYDMVNQKNDYTNFVSDKGYNNQLKRKVEFAVNNLAELSYHNQIHNGATQPNMRDYDVIGFFIINTPTFYMHNSDYRIYLVSDFLEYMLGRKKDPELIVNISTEADERIMKINYPYFRKPTYILPNILNIE